MEKGSVKFQYSSWLSNDAIKIERSQSADLASSKPTWFDIRVSTVGSDVRLGVHGEDDITDVYRGASESSEFAFDSVDVVSMTLGGDGVLPDGRTFKGTYMIFVEILIISTY